MAKTTLNELRHEIADILAEAKKKAKKESKKSSSKLPPQVEAYGHYDGEHDFSFPLGHNNLYKQQGGVNFGPYTGPGPSVESHGAGNPNSKYQMSETDERALRTVVREVIQNGLVDESSAWSSFLPKQEPIFESTWEEVAYRMAEGRWYDKPERASCEDGEGKPKGKGWEKTEYGQVKKHGQEKK